MTSLVEVAQALREAQVIRLSLLQAYQPGDVIVIECNRPHARAVVESLRKVVEDILERTGIQLIILGEGFRVVAREEEVIAGSTP